MSARQPVLLSEPISITIQDDNIVWGKVIGTISLSNLCFYMGTHGGAVSSLPETISIKSHITGRTVKFTHVQHLARDREYYHAILDVRSYGLWVECTPEQMKRIRSAAIEARNRGWNAKIR